MHDAVRKHEFNAGVRFPWSDEIMATLRHGWRTAVGDACTQVAWFTVIVG
jgi:hypothetical protein